MKKYWILQQGQCRDFRNRHDQLAHPLDIRGQDGREVPEKSLPPRQGKCPGRPATRPESTHRLRVRKACALDRSTTAAMTCFASGWPVTSERAPLGCWVRSAKGRGRLTTRNLFRPSGTGPEPGPAPRRSPAHGAYTARRTLRAPFTSPSVGSFLPLFSTCCEPTPTEGIIPATYCLSHLVFSPAKVWSRRTAGVAEGTSLCSTRSKCPRL